jgi:hypothetical protein
MPTTPVTVASVQSPPTADATATAPTTPAASATTTGKAIALNVSPSGHRLNGLPTARPTATAKAVSTGGGGRFD